MNFRYQLITAMTCILLSACAHHPKSGVPADLTQENPTPPSLSSASIQPILHSSSLLEFVDDFSGLSSEAQKKELANILRKISTNSSNLQQKTRAAIIYSIPGSKLRDPLKAQPLLDELARENQLSKEESAIVSILRDNSAEITRLSQRLREEQRRADDNQQKASALQQKLDELKQIERTMMQKSLRDPNRSK